MKITDYSLGIYHADNGKRFLACDGLMYAVEYIGNGLNKPEKLTDEELEAIQDFVKETDPKWYAICERDNALAKKVANGG